MKRYRVHYYTGGVETMKADRTGATDNFQNAVRNAAGHVAVSRHNPGEHRLAIISERDRRGQDHLIASYKLTETGQITVKEFGR